MDHAVNLAAAVADFPAMIDANLPESVQDDLLDLVRGEYRRTNALVRNEYEAPEADDLEPQIRRANIERALPQLAIKHPRLVKVGVGQNRSRNSHRFVTCGPLVMTQSYVEEGRSTPRNARFREGFAGNPGQMLLRPEAEAARLDAVSAANVVYLLITHGPDPENLAMPEHVSLVMMDRDCRPVASMNLVTHAAHRAIRNAATEAVADQVEVKLRKNVAAKRLGSA